MIKCSDYPTIILAFIFANLGEFELIRFQKSKLFSDEIVEKLSQCVTLACSLWPLVIAKASMCQKDSPGWTQLFYVCFFFGGF